MLRSAVALAVFFVAALIASPPASAAAPECADSAACKGDRLCHAGKCVATRATDDLCPADLGCPKPYRWTYFFLDLFCADKLEGKRLALLRKTSERGKIGADGLAWIFNAHGAMHGHAFKHLTALNRFFYDAKAAEWLPDSCEPLMKRWKTAAEVPASRTEARDAVKRLWRAAKARAGATGLFLGKKAGELTARAAVPDDCDAEECPLTLSLVDRKGATVLSQRMDEDLVCDSDAEVEAVQAFAGHATLKLTCDSSMGAAYDETLHLFDARGGKFVPLLAIAAGYREFRTMDEREAGDCPIMPAGWLKVARRGATPLLDTFTAKEHGEQGLGVEQRYRWSATLSRFVPQGEGVERRYQGRRCD